ncbi:3-hydroxybenzoate synthase [Nocardiopsis dassonvillei]
MQTDTDHALGYSLDWGAPSEAAPSDGNILGRIGLLEETVEPGRNANAPYMGLPMLRAGEVPVTETWSSSAPVSTGSEKGIEFGHDGENVFCCTWIPPAPTYRESVRETYGALFRLLADLGYPNIFRVWNMIGEINAPNRDGLEIYRDFCLGRAEAFEAMPDVLGGMPAATGIGSRGAGIGVHLLATRDPGVTHLDNPRQVPAYRYPRRYGPKAPSFSRATRTRAGNTFYVSGTASIVDHRTVHAGDTRAQCEETFRNLTALLSAENLGRYGFEGHELHELDHVKVYHRREADEDMLRSLCSQAFGPAKRIVYANVDVCRSDLLVEIEGIVPGRP